MLFVNENVQKAWIWLGGTNEGSMPIFQQNFFAFFRDFSIRFMRRPYGTITRFGISPRSLVQDMKKLIIYVKGLYLR